MPIRPIDQQTLAAIGGTSQLQSAQGFATSMAQMSQALMQQQKMRREKEQKLFEDKLNRLKLTTEEMKAAREEAEITGAYSQSVLQNFNMLPNEQRTPEAMAAIQQNLRASMPEVIQAKIPLNQSMNQLVSNLKTSSAFRDWDSKQGERFGEFEKIPGTELYGQKSNKTGKFANVRNGIDGKSQQGDSEFERGIKAGLEKGYFDEKEANRLREKRTRVLAGTDMRRGAEARLIDKQSDRYNKETKALREEYTKGAEHFGDMSISIDSAFAAMDSGDTGLSERLLNQVMSQVQDTNVRAYQMYNVFDQEFGHLGQRIVGQVNRFLLGNRTQRETNEIKNVLSHFKEKYVDPAKGKIRDRYRQFAIQQGKEPFIVVPPDNPEDIINSQLVDSKEKVKLIKEFFPNWKPPK